MKHKWNIMVFLVSVAPVLMQGQVRQDFCVTPKPESRILVDADQMRAEGTRSIVFPEVVEVIVQFTTNDQGTLKVVSIEAGEVQRLLLEKIEELTLYLIWLHEENAAVHEYLERLHIKQH